MNFKNRTALPLLFGLVAPALTGCELLVSADRSKIVYESPANGAVGEGGAGGAVGEGGAGGAVGEGGAGGQGGAGSSACGDGAVDAAAEACDDGNTTAGDGCDATCAIEPGYACAGAPSVCTAGCGDGVLGGSEACDDGNNEDGDCCSRSCQVEAGCEVEPNDEPEQANDAFAISSEGIIKAFIDPATDVDFYSVTVPANTSATLTARTLDGPLGTTCDSNQVDSAITLLDESLTEIVSNDDFGANYCSFVSVDGLLPGQYFVRLEISPAAPPATFDYTLSLSLDVALCGDGALDGAELCDDGNLIGGDGCSATCQLDTPVAEAEPNNTPPEADAIGAVRPNALLTGAIEPLGDIDFYAVEVPGIADLRIETFESGSLSACRLGVDTFVRFYDPSGTEELQSDDDSGPEACSRIDPAESDVVQGLQPGTYYVSVEEFTNDATIVPGYNLLLSFTALCGDGEVEGAEECDGGAACNADCTRVAVCGDGFIDSPESCDDGNTEGGDGCTGECTLEGTVLEVEPNNTPAEADVRGPFTPDFFFSAAIEPARDVDYFAVDIPGLMELEIQTFDASGPGSCEGGVDTVVQFLDADGTTVLAEDDDGGLGTCSLLDAETLSGVTPGRRYVRVQHYSRGATSPYFLQVRATALCGNGAVEGAEECDGGATCGDDCQRIATCGDGFVDEPEVCDDGNRASGDGCSAACQLEGVTPEIEPNDTPAEADGNGALPPELLFSGSIAAADDIDVFAVSLTAVSDLRLSTFDGRGPESCVGIETTLSLLGPDGVTVLATDEDSGVELCSSIDPATAGGAGARHLRPGTYYVQVGSFNRETEIPAYTLQVSLAARCGDGVVEGAEECDGGPSCDASCDRRPTCGDGFIDVPEGCDDGNTSAGDGCSATCQLEAAAPEVEPNDTLAQAGASSRVISGDALIGGSVGAVGDHDLTRVTLSTAQVVRFEVFDGTASGCAGGLQTTLRVLDAAGVTVATDEGLADAEYASGIDGCSALVRRLPAGTYYVEVFERGDDATIPVYLLQAKVLTSAGLEIEPNDEEAAASAFAGEDAYILGRRADGDLDFYAITVSAGSSVRAEIIEGGAATCESQSIDSLLSLFDASGELLAFDDDGGRGYCSLLDGTGAAPRHAGAHALPAGTYYLRVRNAAGATPESALFDYGLALTVR